MKVSVATVSKYKKLLEQKNKQNEKGIQKPFAEILRHQQLESHAQAQKGQGEL
jgi:hypothetical protein